MASVRIVAVTAFAAAAAACALPRRAAPGLTPISSLTDTLPVRPPLVGSFTSSMNVAMGAMAAGRAPRVDGTVRLTPHGTHNDRFSVEFSFSSERGPESLAWGVVSGPCGSGDLPLVSPRQLTRIDVQDNGRGRLLTEFRATITPGLDYHVNLYAGDNMDLADVVACANLR
ncbi:MAG: hypothetical protein KGL38_15815 [Gemmatimonadota bacterium]|nr:hypothetical protein [Gemmatimonadota bacterium]MDE3129476.1 hypothetical protein [Gemmatimonadota bacterium]MDE3171722.1 hypothetical protein [Gemmatimonadota bacterium]MDE3216155.1 hypothetical protein [Gemmatimonadota bacterium]